MRVREHQVRALGSSSMRAPSPAPLARPLPEGEVGSDLRDDAVGEAGYVVGHDEEIARATATVLDPVRQHRFHLKSQVLEGGARGGLIGGHLGGDFLEAERAREIEYFSG